MVTNLCCSLMLFLFTDSDSCRAMLSTNADILPFILQVMVFLAYFFVLKNSFALMCTGGKGGLQGIPIDDYAVSCYTIELWLPFPGFDIIKEFPMQSNGRISMFCMPPVQFTFHIKRRASNSSSRSLLCVFHGLFACLGPVFFVSLCIAV